MENAPRFNLGLQPARGRRLNKWTPDQCQFRIDDRPHGCTVESDFEVIAPENHSLERPLGNLPSEDFVTLLRAFGSLLLLKASETIDRRFAGLVSSCMIADCCAPAH